ncbi:helix-turn-helix domain-containing protein [Pontibacillus marinus]|uniref:HTH cro/C1-type domain-containing protein n=1 Tax=Pontibacillus marinus BH030004 = DSM 16465 TaxID=1385511 RepID=A0A0A5GCE9_9BACI|nr:helix-turn-helix domain-containing protein [Pontibacillus marinus]KGX89694.1 hypothetical protein N783_04750 [Pontibacillus marinus BH030004 = DSM 16465]
MDNIGDIVKYYRVLEGMTQEELAKGIISSSYLSKIENNLDKPSTEVLSLLKERLNIKDEMFISNQTLVGELMDWYKDITTKNFADAEAFYDNNKQRFNVTTDLTTLFYFKIFEAYYFLLNSRTEDGIQYFEELQYDIDSLNDKQSYFYYRISGYYYFFHSYFSFALDSFKKAERVLNETINVEEWDVAELYYMLGMTSSRLRLEQQAIYFTTKALEVYKNIYNLSRLAECHLLLGISYGRTDFFDFAENNYLKAKKIADSLDYKILLSKVHHNMAYLNIKKGESEEAIRGLKSSYYYKLDCNVQEQEFLPTIFSLINEYLRISDIENCRIWINEGMKINENNSVVLSLDYDIHFNTINKYINQSDDFEEYCLTTTIPHFKEKNKDEYTARYSHLLGVFYENINKYKQASMKYKESLFLLNKNLGGFLL